MKFRSYLLASAMGAVAMLGASQAAYAADSIKIGMISTQSGRVALLGKHMKDGFDLAIEHLGGKVGGLPTEVIYEDDEQKPDVGKQKAEKLIQKDRVDVVMGITWSNVMLAAFKPIVDSKTLLISLNAGPSDIAGKLCNPYFFSSSWQNDQTPEALGKYLQDAGVKTVFAMAPNYAAGKDMITGFKRYYKGKIVGEVLTKFPDQLDFQAELTQIRNAQPEAVFVFYPGAFGAAFFKQYQQAGLQGKIPLYSAFTVDTTNLPAIGDAAVGSFLTQHWGPDLDNPANKKFVGDFMKKYGYEPSFNTQEAYDGVMMLDAAIRKIGGKIEDKPALIKALETVEFASTRGDFKFNTNHFPIQDFYLQEIVKHPDGRLGPATRKTVLEDHKDAYAEECKMKPPA